MSSSYYIVKIVKRDLLELWHEFWDSDEPSQRAKEANKDGSLGKTDIVHAKNKEQAADLAEQKNPGYVAIRDATERLG
jgi:hypothetical protein